MSRRSTTPRNRTSFTLRPIPSVGGTLGVLFGAAVALRFPESRSLHALFNNAGKLTAAAVGGFGAYGAYRAFVEIDLDGIQDRVYRLHFNEGQNRVDKFAGVGGTAGLLAAAFTSPKPTLLPVLGGLGAGAALGVAAHAATRNLAKPKSA